MTPDDGHPVFAELLKRNRAWVRARLDENPDYFQALAQDQKPPFLFIGCSDSRKCINTMIGTRPGEGFIHRNIANQVHSRDENVLAVLEYALLMLQVQHVAVVGHTRCGGVAAALAGHREGAVGAWLASLRSLVAHNREELDRLPDAESRADRLAELNVVAQVENVLRSQAYHDAVERGHPPEVHGWMFDLKSGLIRELPLPRQAWRDSGLLP
jgi:carbonic anhydrase